MVTKPNQNSHGVEDIDVASLGRALWRAKGWIFWLAISAGARLIKDMLAKNGDVDATTEVLKSDLITRLIEQRVTMQRQLAELSATLLPSHPRIRQLAADLADVRKQIRAEVEKIAQGLENEAQVAATREASLRTSLDDVKGSLGRPLPRMARTKPATRKESP